MRRISSHDRATASLPSETRPRSEARERQRAAAVGKNSCSAAGSGYKRVAIESRRIRQAHPLSSLVTHIQARQTHTSAVKESGFGPLLTPASGSPAKRTSASLHLAAIRQSHTTLYARSHATISPDDSARTSGVPTGSRATRHHARWNQDGTPPRKWRLHSLSDDPSPPTSHLISDCLERVRAGSGDLTVFLFESGISLSCACARLCSDVDPWRQKAE